MSELDAFLERCRGALGSAAVVTDPEVTAGQAVDWTGRWTGATPAVLRPRTTGQVADIVLAARATGVALLAQGGNTGLVGGATPLQREVLVDLRGLDSIGPVDEVAGQVTAGAGVTLSDLQASVRPHGLQLAVDLGARDTATIGGMVATNAGGLHVLRHGSMRAQVLGLTAVLGTGAVLAANPTGLVKDNTGYDLAGLLCGSEGTLGIVTEVRLRLVAVPAARLVALLGFDDVAAAGRAAATARATPSVTALEMMLRDGLATVAAHLGEGLPLAGDPACAVLVELAGDGDLEADLATTLARMADDLRGSAVATDPPGQARLWRWREAHPEAAAAHGLVHKADVTVPLGEVAELVERVPGAVAAVAPGALTLVYGHLGDGNLHVNVVGPAATDERAIDAVLRLALELGGSVSAEHGIGVAKRDWLVRQRGEVAVAVMRSLKAACDPDGVLAPGVLFPDP